MSDATPPRADAASLETAYVAERAQSLVARARWVALASVVGQVIGLAVFDPPNPVGREATAVIRVSAGMMAIAYLVWLRRPRPPQRVITGSVAALCMVAFVSGLAILGAPPAPAIVWSCVVMLLVFLPVPSALALSAREASLFLGAGMLGMGVGLRMRPTHPSLAVILSLESLAIIPYIFTIAGAVPRERLQRAELAARMKLAETIEQLRRNDETRSRLFTNLSHDLRTPLGVIRGEAELLARDTDRPDARATLGRIDRNAAALTDLTDQLLELARLEAGRTPTRPARLDVETLVREIAADMAFGAEDRVRIDGPPLTILVDPDHARRIFANLISNALRHARPHVRVLLRCGSAHEPRAIVEIEDDGAGVAAEHEDRLFERFASFDREGGVAAGIGLPLARELARLNGGDITLDSARRPTRFRVTLLPTSEAPTELHVPARTTHSLAEAPSVVLATNARSVLIVEDHDDMRALLVRSLSDDFRVDAVDCLAVARARLSLHRPSAIVTDVMLPDGSGTELLADPNRASSTPVVLVSALGSPAERAAGIAAGAHDYLAKPFSPAELRTRLLAIVGRTEERAAALATARDGFLSELHDGVSSSLTRALAVLGAMEPSVARATAIGAVSDGLAEARALMTILDNADEEAGDAIGDLRRELADACERGHLLMRFDARAVHPDRRLSPIVCHMLRRTALEAVTNVIRHANAEHVEIELREDEGSLWLSIVDDGRGLAVGAPTGRGLGILRRRAERLGGAASVEAGPVSGTRVWARIPLARP